MFNYTTKIKKAYIAKEQENSIIHNYQYNFVGGDDIIHKYDYSLSQIQNYVKIYAPIVKYVWTKVYLSVATASDSVVITSYPYGHDSSIDDYDNPPPTVKNYGYQYDRSNNVFKHYGYTVFSGRVVGTAHRVIWNESKTEIIADYYVNVIASGYDYIDSNGDVQEQILSSVAEDMGSPSDIKLVAKAHHDGAIWNSSANCYLTTLYIKYIATDQSGNETTGWVNGGNGLFAAKVETGSNFKCDNTYELSQSITDII